MPTNSNKYSSCHRSGELLIPSVARLLAGIALLVCPLLPFAADAPFSGKWSIDLQTPEEKRRNVDCGSATFELVQTENRITGSHSMYLAGCGRLNEGGEGTVKGVVVGSTAVMVVTSGRNGAVAMGTGQPKGTKLHWQLIEEIKPGEPEGDSPLILERGVLSRLRK